MGFAEHFRAIFGPGENDWIKNAPVGGVPELPAFEQRVPRLASVTRAPSREAFDAWREHPVTLFAFAALARAAKEQEAAWAGTSWEGGFADQNLLNELRVRADAYNSMQEADYLGFCEWAGVEPNGDNS